MLKVLLNFIILSILFLQFNQPAQARSPLTVKSPAASRLPCEKRPQKTEIKQKYSQLLHVLKLPEDCNEYGGFHDFGYWEGANYKGHKNLKAGYWVYQYPNWYVYKNSRLEKQCSITKNKLTPSVKGKYAYLLKKIAAKQDHHQYGCFNDYGFFEKTIYSGVEVPSGYWVYQYPHWYIWGLDRSTRPATPMIAPGNNNG